MTIQEDFVVFYSEQHQIWFENGKLHRLHGPATIKSDGSQYWFKNDKRHRIGGPAILYPGGAKSWYLNGKSVTQDEAER